MIFFCLEGFVNNLLSWKGFIPLSRLTYVMYLVHLNYMAVYYARARKPIYYTMWDTVQAYFGFLLAVILLAFAICLVVEVPFLNLEKLFFSYSKGGITLKTFFLAVYNIFSLIHNHRKIKCQNSSCKWNQSS